MKKNQHGFTLAELLVVIAIVGILAAISIPIFTAQRKKAVIAANQANVRAAKAAAVAMLYGSKESLERYENQPQKQYRYYRYNVKEGKIVCQAEGENAHIEYAQGSGTKKVNDLGQEYRKTAMEAKTPCTDILVYIGNPAANPYANTSPLQTAPFYEGRSWGNPARIHLVQSRDLAPNKRNEIGRFKIKIAFYISWKI